MNTKTFHINLMNIDFDKINCMDNPASERYLFHDNECEFTLISKYEYGSTETWTRIHGYIYVHVHNRETR